MFFVMPRALKPGSAAQVIEHFQPENGSFDYLYNTGNADPSTNKPIQERESVVYSAAGLFGLLPTTDVFQGVEPGAQPITYGEATAALQQLINASPFYRRMPRRKTR